MTNRAVLDEWNTRALALTATPPKEAAMAVVPFAVWRPVNSHGGPMTAHQGLVLHVQAGNNSPWGWFANPLNQVSSTWWVSKTGVLEQYVDSNLAAWAEAAGNSTWDSVETEGFPSEPLTAAQVSMLARLYAWGVTAYGWPLTIAETPTSRGFICHSDGGVRWGNHPQCPGLIRAGQRQAILAAAAIPARPPAPVGTTTAVDKELGPVQKQLIMINVANGCGDLHTTIPFNTVIGLMKQGSDPEIDHTYWSGSAQGQERDGNLLITVTDCRTGFPEGLAPLTGQAGVFVTTTVT